MSLPLLLIYFSIWCFKVGFSCFPILPFLFIVKFWTSPGKIDIVSMLISLHDRRFCFSISPKLLLESSAASHFLFIFSSAHSKMDSGYTLNTVTTTWTPAWSSPSWWRTAAISTSLRLVASCSKWSTLLLMVSFWLQSRRSASIPYNWLSSSSIPPKTIGKWLREVGVRERTSCTCWLLWSLSVLSPSLSFC